MPIAGLMTVSIDMSLKDSANAAQSFAAISVCCNSNAAWK